MELAEAIELLANPHLNSLQQDVAELLGRWTTYTGSDLRKWHEFRQDAQGMLQGIDQCVSDMWTTMEHKITGKLTSEELSCCYEYVSRHKAAAEQLRSQYQAALRESGQRVARMSRAQLFRNVVKGEEAKSSGDAERDEMDREQQIAGSLQRTRNLMGQEIDRTSNTLKVLESSTETMAGAHEQYQGYAEVMQNVDEVLKDLRRRAWWEKVVYWGGVVLFCVAVGLIVLRRVMGLVAFVWWLSTPLRMLVVVVWDVVEATGLLSPTSTAALSSQVASIAEGPMVG